MIPAYLVDGFLEISAARMPDKIALISGGQRLTYRQMEEWANRIAHRLIEAGIERGDRVAIWLENGPDAAASIFGVLKAGAVFVPVNPGTKEDKLRYILADCGARALITSERKSNGFSASGVAIIHPANTATYPVGTPEKRCIDLDLAAIIYTSGSTGRPKGVMLTHLNMVSAANSITSYLENTEDDIILNVLPLSFDYGLYQLLMAFKIGGTLVLERGFVYPFQLVETIIREGVTGLPLVPTIAAILLQMDLSKYSFPALRYITNTAAALPPAHISRLRALFPDVQIFSMYGLTECKRVSYLPPEQIDLRPASVGRGMPNEEVYLIDEAGNRLAPGNTGELVVRGSNVMKGYWNLPEETAKMLKPGPLPGEMVLHTGDLFRTDSEGYLYFVGRKDDIIKCRGEKVSPREIENVLCTMPEVREAAVIGVPDPLLGEAVVAFVALREGAVMRDREILRFCAAHLEEYLVPQRVRVVEALPKSLNGKVDKHELARSLED
jgi:amino acid adenylation domain-containing protein